MKLSEALREGRRKNYAMVWEWVGWSQGRGMLFE